MSKKRERLYIAAITLLVLLLCGLIVFGLFMIDNTNIEKRAIAENNSRGWEDSAKDRRWYSLSDPVYSDVFYDGETGVYYAIFENMQTGSITVTPLYNVDGTLVTVDDIHTRDVG